MHSIIFLSCLITVAHSVCQQRNWPWNPSSGQLTNTWGRTFESAAMDIAQGVIATDRKIQSFCHSYANHDMREIYGSDYYRLLVSLPDIADNNIAVRVLHRIVLVSAQDCSRTYADVKLLPDVVDPRSAVWKYSQGELVIQFPYKMAPSVQVVKNCGAFIDESVVRVPKQTSGNCQFSCSAGFSDGVIKDNVWHRASPATVVPFSGGGFQQNGGFGYGNTNNEQVFKK